MQKIITPTRRTRSTHFSHRVEQAGVKGYTVYNHMLLPTVFESGEADYWHLCEHVQVWDVSVQRQVELLGEDAAHLAQLMTPRDLSNAKELQGKYAPICTAKGNIINDPVLIKLNDNRWWLSLADSDIKFWADGLAQGFGLKVDVFEPDVSPLAVQGPKAQELMTRVFGNEVQDIRFFWGKMLSFQNRELYVARSGWSKQGGFEIYLDDPSIADALWDALFAAGEDLQVRAGCPNQIERMESGLLSYGSDMDEKNNLFECGLDSYINLDADVNSLSLPALRAMADQQTHKLRGVLFPQPMTLESCQPLLPDDPKTELRSQSWSPRYNKHMAFAMLPMDYTNKHSSISVNGVDGVITDIPFTKELLES